MIYPSDINLEKDVLLATMRQRKAQLQKQIDEYTKAIELLEKHPEFTSLIAVIRMIFRY